MDWHKIDGTTISDVQLGTHTILVHGLPESPTPRILFKTIHDLRCCTYRVYIKHDRLEVCVHSATYPLYIRDFNPKDAPTLSQIKVEVEQQIILHEL